MRYLALLCLLLIVSCVTNKHIESRTYAKAKSYQEIEPDLQEFCQQNNYQCTAIDSGDVKFSMVTGNYHIFSIIEDLDTLTILYQSHGHKNRDLRILDSLEQILVSQPNESLQPSELCNAKEEYNNFWKTCYKGDWNPTSFKDCHMVFDSIHTNHENISDSILGNKVQELRDYKKEVGVDNYYKKEVAKFKEERQKHDCFHSATPSCVDNSIWLVRCNKGSSNYLCSKYEWDWEKKPFFYDSCKKKAGY